jgi:hypothetical protein
MICRGRARETEFAHALFGTADASTSESLPSRCVSSADAGKASVLALIWIGLLLRFVDLQIISVLLGQASIFRLVALTLRNDLELTDAK